MHDSTHQFLLISGDEQLSHVTLFKCKNEQKGKIFFNPEIMGKFFLLLNWLLPVVFLGIQLV